MTITPGPSFLCHRNQRDPSPPLAPGSGQRGLSYRSVGDFGRSSDCYCSSLGCTEPSHIDTRHGVNRLGFDRTGFDHTSCSRSLDSGALGRSHIAADRTPSCSSTNHNFGCNATDFGFVDANSLAFVVCLKPLCHFSH